MAFTYPEGTRLVVISGQYRGHSGKVVTRGRIKLLVLDHGKGELMGVDDSMVRRAHGK